MEGEYKHIIGVSNIHAPDPVHLTPYTDSYSITEDEKGIWEKVYQEYLLLHLCHLVFR